MNTIDPKTGMPMPQPVFPPPAQQAGQAMFGTQQPGSYDRVMPLSPLGKIDPTKKGHSSVKSLTAQKKYNDQLRRQQAEKPPKKAYTKKIGKIEKVPKFSYTVVKKDLQRIDAIPQDQKNKL